MSDENEPKMATEWLIGHLKDSHFGAHEVKNDALYYAADDLEWMSSRLKAVSHLLEKEPNKHARSHEYACEMINEIWAILKVN